MGVAIVTGANGAIGSAVCRLLSAKGERVVALDVMAPQLKGVEGLMLSCDVTSRSEVRRAVEEAQDRFGAVTSLVNVAGVVSKGSVLSLSNMEFDRVMRINVLGTLIPCQVVGQIMADQGHGAIVNIGSVVGKNGGNARAWLDRSEIEVAGGVAYGMSKSAVHTLTFFLAKELASFGVRVNGVAPGPIGTAMTDAFPENLRALIPQGRMGRPEEVASVVAFLLSEQASFICGEIIDVNGALWCD